MVWMVWGATLASRPKGQQPTAAALRNEVLECHQPVRAPLYTIPPYAMFIVTQLQNLRKRQFVAR